MDDSRGADGVANERFTIYRTARGDWLDAARRNPGIHVVPGFGANREYMFLWCVIKQWIRSISFSSILFPGFGDNREYLTFFQSSCRILSCYSGIPREKESSSVALTGHVTNCLCASSTASSADCSRFVSARRQKTVRIEIYITDNVLN